MAHYYGLRLGAVGTPELSWRRLGVLVRNLPRESVTALDVLGEDVRWTLTDHLLATAVDALHGGNWQRGGGKGKRPTPIPRPGVMDQSVTVERYGSESMTFEELHARLAQTRGDE